ncbi:MAG: DUF2334 domain-containing protein [Parcubacteria group bacterium]|nr:DUF2334 domain-containing protein [Parcubacteria group bacterium]
MTPPGGLFLSLHLIIIFFRWARKNPKSFLILATTATVIIASALTTVKAQLKDAESNVHFLSYLINPCRPLALTGSAERSVVIRIDDIQAFAWPEITTRLIRDTIAHGAPPVLAVIPKGLTEDKRLYYFLKRNRCRIEVAQHGWDHSGEVPESSEFEDLSYDEAYRLIMQGKTILEELSGRELTTFVPPHNTFSTGTTDALEKTGFKIISSELEGEFAYTAAIYNFDTNSFSSPTEIVNACQKRFEKGAWCIVLVHPQDFATNGVLNETSYEEYLTLLDVLTRMDVRFVTMQDLLKQ